MKPKQKTKKEDSGFMQHITVGTITSLLFAFVSTGIFAVLISKEIISEEITGYCSIGIVLLSSIVGSSIAMSKCIHKRIYISLITGVAYCVTLMISTGLFFRGEFQRIWSTVAVIISGCIIATFTRRNRTNKVTVRSNKIRHW